MKKALILAIGLAFATPTISIASALPSNLVGLSLGEIQSQSYLNEPFKGVIPILFSNVNESKNLKVRLAPDAVFQKVGAEKLSVLYSLKFQIGEINNKPVIKISSNEAIQMPFLNFVLEIESPKGSIYQDYTTLLDPKESTQSSFTANLNNSLQQINQQKASSYAPISTNVVIGTDRTLKVKSGDTLSQIARALNSADVSLKKMISAIHQRNPKAFVNNNINLLKAGAVLHIPTNSELNNSSFKAAAKSAVKNRQLSENNTASKKTTYTIKKGDNLSKITKKFTGEGVSFTKLMKEIHSTNPHAFSKNRINILKVGKVLTIPTMGVNVETNIKSKEISEKNSIHSNQANSDSNLEGNETGKEFVLSGFVIEKGDTLSSITKQIGHEGIPYSKMMQAIYVANPHAFEKNNITMLIEGSIIRLPSISEIEGRENFNSEKNSDSIELDKNSPIKEETLNKQQNNKLSENDSKLAITQLEKRVRELKRDLNKAHSNLTNLELSLAGKDVLLKQQSNDLSKLASTLELLNSGNSVKKTKSDDEIQTILPENSTLDSFKSEYIDPNSSDQKTISGSSEGKNITSNDIQSLSSNEFIPVEINQTLHSNMKEKLALYSQYMSGKELLASILALLFGLVLIRYRREIYAYTNISYDYPKYYPPFGEEEAKQLLKDKSINYQDTLVNSTEDIHKENNPVFSDAQIEECENLADELIESLEIKTSTHDDNSGWSELDKACDDYIEEYKEKNILEITDVNNELIEGTNQKQEDMTFELFEALAKGVSDKEEDSKVTSNNTIEDDTLIYGLNSKQTLGFDSPFDDKQAIPIGELEALSKKMDLEKSKVS